MRAIPQLVSAPLNPIPIVEHFRWSHPQCEHSYGQEMLISLRSRKTFRHSEQIMSADKYPSIFSCQMEAIVYIYVASYVGRKSEGKVK